LNLNRNIYGSEKIYSILLYIFLYALFFVASSERGQNNACKKNHMKKYLIKLQCNIVIVIKLTNKKVINLKKIWFVFKKKEIETD